MSDGIEINLSPATKACPFCKYGINTGTIMGVLEEALTMLTSVPPGQLPAAQHGVIVALLMTMYLHLHHDGYRAKPGVAAELKDKYLAIFIEAMQGFNASVAPVENADADWFDTEGDWRMQVAETYQPSDDNQDA